MSTTAAHARTTNRSDLDPDRPGHRWPLFAGFVADLLGLVAAAIALVLFLTGGAGGAGLDTLRVNEATSVELTAQSHTIYTDKATQESYCSVAGPDGEAVTLFSVLTAITIDGQWTAVGEFSAASAGTYQLTCQSADDAAGFAVGVTSEATPNESSVSPMPFVIAAIVLFVAGFALLALGLIRRSKRSS